MHARTARTRKVALVGAVSIAALLFTGCSKGADTSAKETPTPTPGTSQPATSPTEQAAAAAVAVTLGETGTQHMYMKIDPATVAAGTVTFTIKNEGKKVHEFVVLDTPVATKDLKMKSGVDEVNEDAYKSVDEVGEIKPGATETLTVTLHAGHFALICNIKKHFRMGMYADLTVS